MVGRVLKSLPACALIAVAATAAPAASQFGQAQEPVYTFGASLDLVSHYVWRGLDLSDVPNIQPSVWVSFGAFDLGTWGSHTFDGSYHEQDFWLTYNFPQGTGGDLAVTLTDYYANPDFGTDFFEFAGAGACPAGVTGFGRPPRCARGAHTVEVAAQYSSHGAPFDLLAAYNIHNDPENSIYLEGRLRPVVAGFDLGFTLGGVPGTSGFYYGTDGAAIVNLAAGVGRTLSLGSFSLPLTAEVVHNPHVGETFYVARLGIAIGD